MHFRMARGLGYAILVWRANWDAQLSYDARIVGICACRIHGARMHFPYDRRYANVPSSPSAPEFSGHSCIAGPDGQRLAHAGVAEGAFAFSCDPAPFVRAYAYENPVWAAHSTYAFHHAQIRRLLCAEPVHERPHSLVVRPNRGGQREHFPAQVTACANA